MMGAMARYTHGHHESVLRSHRWRTAENSVAYLLSHLRPEHTLLDVGAGPGTITADLGQRVARVTALEATAEALALSRATLAERGVDADFVVGDVLALDFADASFDVVHAHQVLQHVADPVRALREMRRVCRPGGLVAVRDADYAAFSWAPGSPVLDGWLALYRRLARINGGEPDAGRHLLAWAHASGAVDVEPSASVWCFATPADRTWWGGLWADRLLESAFGQQARSDGLATAAELDAMATAFRDWAEHPDGWFLVPHGELIIRT